MEAKAMLFLTKILLLSAWANQTGEQLMHQEIERQMRAPVAYACGEMRTENLKRSGQVDLRLFKQGILYAQEGGQWVQFVAFEMVDPLRFRGQLYLVKIYQDGRKEETAWPKGERRSHRYHRGDRDGVEATTYQVYDLSDHLDEYSYKLLQDQGQRKRIQALPRRLSRTPYGELAIELQEIAPGEMVYRSIRFFDPKGSLQKEERYFDFVRLGRQWWRPRRIEMEDLRGGYRTQVRLWDWTVQEQAGREDRDIFRRLLQGQGSLPCRCTSGKGAGEGRP